MLPKMNTCQSQNHFMSPKCISCRQNNFMSPNIYSCRRENHFMSPIKFPLPKIDSCRSQNDFMSQNAFHVAKTFSYRQKCFSCRQKLNFMSSKLFHVTEKVDFPDGWVTVDGSQPFSPSRIIKIFGWDCSKKFCTGGPQKVTFSGKVLTESVTS